MYTSYGSQTLSPTLSPLFTSRTGFFALPRIYQVHTQLGLSLFVPEIFNSLSTFLASSLPSCKSPLKSHLFNGAHPGQPVIKANWFSHSQTPFSITGFFLFPYHLLTFNIFYDYLLCILFIICLFHG